MTIEEFLANLKPLTLTQYDNAKANVLVRLRPIIGEKPTREKLRVEQASLLGPLDYLALVVFVAALAISSVHIVKHAGSMAQTVCAVGAIGQGLTEPAGINITSSACVVAHQVGFIFLAEASMLLFMVNWRVQSTGENDQGSFKLRKLTIRRSLFSVSLGLALLAMFFVLLANLQSGLSPLEAVMPPIFTIGIGFHVEHLITEIMRREAELTVRFKERLTIWEKADDDPTTHPEYRKLLLREIWETLAKMKDNKELADVPGRFKYAAVMRELERDVWAHDEVQVEQAAQASGTTMENVADEPGLQQLITLIKGIPDGVKGSAAIINLPTHSANLVELTWLDKATAKTYGPYKSRRNLLYALHERARREGLQA